MNHKFQIGDKVRSVYAGPDHNFGVLLIIIDILDDEKFEKYGYKFDQSSITFPVFLCQRVDGLGMHSRYFNYIPDNQEIYSGWFLRLLKIPEYMNET